MTSAFSGTPTLVRSALRRDRVRLLVWVVAVAVVMVASAATQLGLYPTQADRDVYAATVGASAAARAIQGAAYGLDTLGGIVAYETAVFGFVAVALMSLLLVARHVRGEEESGRTELVRAAAVGRYAGTAAALAVAVLANVAVAVAVGAAYAALGLPGTGSLALAAGLAAVGVTFGAVAAVTAQVTEHTRAATGMAAAVLGTAFAMRAVGDVGGAGLSWLSWLSPLGWAQSVRPYAGERWAPLLLPLAAVVLLAGTSLALVDRRDVGAGLVSARPGRPTASAWLRSTGGLALRLHRAALLGWLAGLFLLGIAYGSVGREVETLAAENEVVAEFVARSGVSLTDAFFATVSLTLGLLVAGYAVAATLRLRGEETAGRAEVLLATATPRWRWAASHLAVAVVGSALLLGAAGLGVGAAHALLTDDPAAVPRLAGAALVHAPAVWALAGVALAAFGLAPRASAAVAWVALAGCAVVGILGQALALPGWLLALSPFDHVPALPAARLDVAPVLLLAGVAAGLAAVGLTGLARRDVG